MSNTLNILVTGANGQLGYEINANCQKDGRIFHFTDQDGLDITDRDAIASFFDKHTIDVCINAAGYTAVDLAEKEPGKAYLANETGARHLAEIAKKHDALLIHFSTDFVFAGTHCRPYREEDVPRPLNVYGKSKLAGERAVALANRDAIILRTSWLFSTHGSNFVKTMLKLAEAGQDLRVIDDQIGTPTYAADLALAIDGFISLVEEKGSPKIEPGTYHFSNEGAASWYDFSMAIFDLAGKNIKVTPVHTEEYPTPAVRPHYSVMDKKKIKEFLGLEIRHWRVALADCIDKIK